MYLCNSTLLKSAETRHKASKTKHNNRAANSQLAVVVVDVTSQVVERVASFLVDEDLEHSFQRVETMAEEA